ncbi:hypothetical protein PPERSA_00883 [Pseudocohnilembus persalinus]|uniref:Uncharacterized protein n=1 Tax=Pseudocohnilembus persalinus TaxID=266149 RepID=A0A0V0QEV7_PSEPJ|nr:hypothetical protein PPERSA_00883 [Pseudocohnilembus persalinus]|eukprot:KRX00656.1 hypothetical protein PPERSA_00883 [Pseudocohnilembus persalinus]
MINLINPDRKKDNQKKPYTDQEIDDVILQLNINNKNSIAKTLEMLPTYENKILFINKVLYKKKYTNDLQLKLQIIKSGPLVKKFLQQIGYKFNLKLDSELLSVGQKQKKSHRRSKTDDIAQQQISQKKNDLKQGDLLLIQQHASLIGNILNVNQDKIDQQKYNLESQQQQLKKQQIKRKMKRFSNSISQQKSFNPSLFSKQIQNQDIQSITTNNNNKQGNSQVKSGKLFKILRKNIEQNRINLENVSHKSSTLLKNGLIKQAYKTCSILNQYQIENLYAHFKKFQPFQQGQSSHYKDSKKEKYINYLNTYKIGRDKINEVNQIKDVNKLFNQDAIQGVVQEMRQFLDINPRCQNLIISPAKMTKQQNQIIEKQLKKSQNSSFFYSE